MPDEDAVRKPTRFELLLDFVKTRLLSIVALLSIAAGIAMIVGFDISLTRWQKIAIYTGAAFAPLGLFLGKYITSVLYDPNHIFLVDLDAGRIDGALYRFPYTDFRDLTITDENGNPDAPYQITQLTPNLYVGKDIDIEEMTVVGTWRGTLDDRELARALQKVRECREQLQEDAQRGFVLETSAFTIVRRAARETLLNVVQMFKSGSLPDQGEALNEAVDDALEQFDFQEELDDSLMDDVSDPEEASQRLDDLEDDRDDHAGNGVELTNTEAPTND